MASPLQLTYSFMWQAIRQRNVSHYKKVEEFVTVVTQTVPELMSSKQTAQLVLGLRARIILDLLQREAQPDARIIQTLINKLKIVTPTVDAEVERCQTNFMVLVQNLLKSPAERKHFFKEVFPVQYGTKFDTALQTLTAGLVCKLEQLLPVPNLSQLSAMISSEPAMQEVGWNVIPEGDDLRTLLVFQQSKGLLSGKATISSSVGDCVLSSLGYLLKPVQPPAPPPPPPPPAASNSSQQPATTPQIAIPPQIAAPPPIANPPPIVNPPPIAKPPPTASPPPLLVQEDLDDTSEDSEEGAGLVGDGGQVAEGLPTATPAAPEANAPGEQGADEAADKSETRRAKSIPFKVVSVAAKTAWANPGMAKDGQKLQTQRVTLHQWVSQIASNTISLPALPPLPPDRFSQDDYSRPSIRRKKHIRPPADRFNCSMCDKSFPYQSKLVDHERIHTGEKPFACTSCPKSFRTQAFLNNHLKTHSTARPYTCGQCGKCFAKLQSLAKHMLAHSGQKPFYCEVCNKGFTQSTYFKRHMECHTSQMTFPCKHCNKSFPTAFKLANHERWHTRDRPHMCERCGKCFLVPSLLKRHMGYHIGDRQYLCSQCGKTFVYLSDLKRHQQDHMPKTKIPCPVCQKKFSSKYCLRVHLRIHTRERPYRCSICEKSFTQVGNLKVHIRLHTDERPFACSQCGKTYKLASHLNVHKRTHSCKKPWTCQTCGKGFSVPGLLKNHEQVHLRQADPDFAAKRRSRAKQKKTNLKRKFDNDGGEEEEEEEEEEEGIDQFVGP
ncbi:uncharacterized protein LOC144180977 isoform X2 [Stigmatopora nigra]